MKNKGKVKKVIAIIPARAGSKRIKNKNIIKLYGKPMIVWTIEAALQSGIFSDVLVSTDGPEIAELAKNLGASVPFLRDKEDADDNTPVWTATTNALKQMESYKKEKYDVIIQLMPNCPCRTAVDILKSYEAFSTSGANFQISVFQFGWMNPWWAMKVDKEKRTTTPVFPEALRQRSQDLEKLFCPTGAIWIAKTEAIKKAGTFYGPNYEVFVLDWQSAVDIDEEDDLRMAEVVLYLRDTQRKNLD